MLQTLQALGGGEKDDVMIKKIYFQNWKDATNIYKASKEEMEMMAEVQ